MTFLEWLSKYRPEELPNQVMLLKDAWELGQAAERERIKQIIEEVWRQGNHDKWFDCANTILDRFNGEEQ